MLKYIIIIILIVPLLGTAEEDEQNEKDRVMCLLFAGKPKMSAWNTVDCWEQPTCEHQCAPLGGKYGEWCIEEGAF